MTTLSDKTTETRRLAAGQRGGRVMRALTELQEAIEDMRMGDTCPSTRRGFFRLLKTLEKLDRDGIPHL